MSKNQSDNSSLCGLRDYNRSVNGVVVLKALDYQSFSLPLERVFLFVIPAKFVPDGREPGSRKKLIILKFHWIPDLAPRSGARPE